MMSAEAGSFHGNVSCCSPLLQRITAYTLHITFFRQDLGKLKDTIIYNKEKQAHA